MLVEFNVQNFRSFKDRATLSLIAAKLKALDTGVDERNVISVSPKLSVLRSAIIYGANAGGKSNLIKAFQFMRRFVIESANKLQEEDEIPVEPFCLATETLGEPTEVEAVFLIDNVQYRYGFSATKKAVVSEWLYYVPTRREVQVFERNGSDLHVNPRLIREGHVLLHLMRKNALFLSVAAQFNVDLARRVREWFLYGTASLMAHQFQNYMPYTTKCLEGFYADPVQELVRRLDVGIKGLATLDVEGGAANLASATGVDTVSSNGSAEHGLDEQTSIVPGKLVKRILSKHDVRGADGLVASTDEFNAMKMESNGTIKLIALAGPIVDTLSRGLVLFVDEIDSQLHPVLTRALLGLFSSPETNPKNAQLICASHDTNLLDKSIFRRDQIYFVEKDETASSRLYSLADFRSSKSGGNTPMVRNDSDYSRNYIQGRYGAIPYLGDIEQLFAEEVAALTGEPSPVQAGVN